MTESVVLSSSEMAGLAGRTVLFGHQSVGANVLEGVAESAREEAWPRWDVLDVAEGRPGEPALLHFRVGRNGDPPSKIRDFERALRGFEPTPPDLAGFKFCYADIDSSTDVDSIFRDYRDALDRMARDFPSVRFFHVTVPVERNEAAIRLLAKKLLGRASAQDSNRARGRYNRMLLDAFGRTTFDLAAAEADRAQDPERPALSPRFTDDGSHLNARGRRAVGRRFVAFLAGLASTDGDAR